MKRLVLLSILSLVLTSCVDHVYVASYWWIKNMTEDTLNISFRSVSGDSNHMIQNTVNPGDSVSIYPGLHWEQQRKIPDRETMFADICGVDSIHVCGKDNELLMILDRASQHDLYVMDSWDFYQPMGTCYNYVWVYELEYADLNLD